MMLPIVVAIATLQVVAPHAVTEQPPEVAMVAPRMICDFTDAADPEWFPVDDVVMGGVSRSELRRTTQDTGEFTGRLSLENNGGFASIRARFGPLDCSAHEGLEVRVRGDGRSYQVRLRHDEGFDGVAYRAHLECPPDEWVTVFLPFRAFEPTFRGQTVAGASPLDPSCLRQISFMIADKRSGAFALEIDFVRAVGAADGGS